MPNEILSRIFFHCLDDNPLDILQPSVRVAPLLLCQICSLWRTVALSLPELWEYLYLRLEDPYTHPGSPGILQKDIDILGLWTSNASYLHPSLHLTFNTPFFPRQWKVKQDNFVHFETLFEFICSARLLDLIWLNNLNIFSSHTDQYEAYDFPNLEILALEVGAVVRYPPRSKFEIRAPSLRRLALNRKLYDQEYTLTKYSFHWEHLTHCFIAYRISLGTWYEILTSCVNLVCGAFFVQKFFSERYKPTVLPNLRQLNISFGSNGLPENIFLDLSFPFLKALRLTNRSPCCRKFFLQEILVPMPSLVELHLNTLFEVDNSSDVLSKFVPNLQILVFSVLAPTPLLDSIAEALRSPWLTNGWLSKRTEPGLIKCIVNPRDKFKPIREGQIAEDVCQHLVSLPEYPFTSVLATEESPKWNCSYWPIMTAYKLEHRWHEFMEFFQRSYD